MIGKYKLDGHTPILCTDLMDWARWQETADRRVAKTDIGEITISTVFLGLDHNFGLGPPILFETMIFGGSLDQEMDRYCTWEEAEAGHEAMVQRVIESEIWYNKIGFRIGWCYAWLKNKVTLVTRGIKRYIENKRFSKSIK